MSAVAIVDCGAGNLHSVEKAVRHVASTEDSIVVTQDPKEVERATHLLLPGVGAFADCMAGLNAAPGLREALTREVESGKPFLGICVGMQMLLEEGQEHGTHPGLGWIKGRVEALRPADASLKIPHMGWNDLTVKRPHALLEGIQTGDHAYFVHSYHVRCADAGDVAAVTDYGVEVTAMVVRRNIAGVQFHPEKSQSTGLRLLKNFLGWRP